MLEVASGLLVACLPVIPKFVTVVWNTTAGSKVGTTLRSVLRLSSHSSTDKHVPLDEGEEILTIGRQPGPMRKAFRPGVSDIDYENLMAETRDTGGTKTGGELITMTDMSWVSDTRESRKGSGTAQSFPSTYKGER